MEDKEHIYQEVEPLGSGRIKTEPTQEARAEAKFILIMPSNKEEKTAKRD